MKLRRVENRSPLRCIVLEISRGGQIDPPPPDGVRLGLPPGRVLTESSKILSLTGKTEQLEEPLDTIIASSKNSATLLTIP